MGDVVSELAKRMAAARAAQTFEPTEPPEKPPNPKPPAAKKKTAEPKKTAKPAQVTKQAHRPVPATTITATESAPTANAAARQAAGLQTGPSLSRAEYMALRRQTMASLTFEIHPDQKAELLRAATENGLSLRAEVMNRLGFTEE